MFATLHPGNLLDVRFPSLLYSVNRGAQSVVLLHGNVLHAKSQDRLAAQIAKHGASS